MHCVATAAAAARRPPRPPPALLLATLALFAQRSALVSAKTLLVDNFGGDCASPACAAPCRCATLRDALDDWPPAAAAGDTVRVVADVLVQGNTLDFNV